MAVDSSACIGAKLGDQQWRLILAKLLQYFHVKTSALRKDMGKLLDRPKGSIDREAVGNSSSSSYLAPLNTADPDMSDRSAHKIFSFCFRGREESAQSGSAINIELDVLGNSAATEDWISASPATTGMNGAIHYSCCQNYCFSWLDLPAEEATLVSRQAGECYDGLLHTAKTNGYEHLLRAWNYYPSINCGAGDDERYRKFSEGRAQALSDHGYTPAHYPAGTAVGTQSGQRMQIVLLSGKQPGQMVENPRQTSAYNYPREYGPTSPSFARASHHEGTHSDQLFVSGTASIVGSASTHIDDFWGQLDETLRNIEELIADRKIVRKQDKTPLLRVYIRNTVNEDTLARMEDRIFAQLGRESRLILLQADICRAELALEIEGLFWLEPA